MGLKSSVEMDNRIEELYANSFKESGEVGSFYRKEGRE